MSETEILLEICNQIKLLRKEVAGANSPTISTSEVFKILGTKSHRALKHFHEQGLLNRYGSQKSGHRYSRAEIAMLQTKLMIGEITMPKR